jgi:glycosyltransferase involved in cell wall biosynthesis
MEDIQEILPMVDQIIGCNDKHSNGKGWAVREALRCATGNIIIILDGDGDINPKMVRRLLPFLEDYDVVVGTKPISGLWSRRLLTYWSRLYIALLFGPKCDTQTGCKVFKRYALTEWYSNGYLYDLEILSVAKKNEMKIIEVPIECQTVNKPMKISSIWKTFKESITLFLELR